MIIDRPGSHFIFVLHGDHVLRNYNYINYNGKELTNREYLEYWGKWILFGTREELDALAAKLDRFVENKTIPGVKYDREIIPEFQLENCVMCVFCDYRQREEVWEVLVSQGIDGERKAWVYERETMERWLPGGYLLEKWIQGQGLDEQQAEMERRKSKDRFNTLFSDEQAIFRGIRQ